MATKIIAEIEHSDPGTLLRELDRLYYAMDVPESSNSWCYMYGVRQAMIDSPLSRPKQGTYCIQLPHPINLSPEGGSFEAKRYSGMLVVDVGGLGWKLDALGGFKGEGTGYVQIRIENATVIPPVAEAKPKSWWWF